MKKCITKINKKADLSLSICFQSRVFSNFATYPIPLWFEQTCSMLPLIMTPGLYKTGVPVSFTSIWLSLQSLSKRRMKLASYSEREMRMKTKNTEKSAD